MRQARWLAGLMALAMSSAVYGYLCKPTEVAEGLSWGEAWVKLHPDKAEGYYFLARVNGFAWANGDDKDTRMELGSWGDVLAAPYFVPWDSMLYERKAGREVTAEAQKYLAASITAYRKAAALEPENARYQLGLGWALKQAGTCRLVPPADMAPAAKLSGEEAARIQAAIGQLSAQEFAVREKAAEALRAQMPAAAEILAATKTDDVEVRVQIDGVFRRYWEAQAVTHYRMAYGLIVEKELKAELYDDLAENTISVKAGEGLLALMSADASNREERNRVEAAIKTIKAKPRMGHEF